MGKTITPDDFFTTSSRWLTNDALITFYTSVVQKRHAEVQQITDRGYNEAGFNQCPSCFDAGGDNCWSHKWTVWHHGQGRRAWMTWQQASVDPCRADTKLKRDLRYCSMMYYVLFARIFTLFFSAFDICWHVLTPANIVLAGRYRRDFMQP